MDKIKKALAFLKKNWYAALCTLTLFLIAIEVIGTWAGFGVPFLVGFVLLSRKIILG
jgi:hypothetical protein